MHRLILLLVLAIASLASLQAQNYTISPKVAKYAVVLEYTPDIGVAVLQITFFGSVDAKKEESFVRLQAEEARKKAPGNVDVIVYLYSQPAGQSEKSMKFPDGSAFLVYRWKDMTLYSEKTDPQFGKK